MHGITYIWQSQAPVSINSCLTIEGLLKKCITEEVPCGFFLRTVIVNRGNSCELKPRKKKRSCLASMARFISVLERFETYKPYHLKIFTFASKRVLLELLSYGECNHPFISVTCFLKTTHLSVHLNLAICYLANLKAYTSKISSWKIFFNSKKMAKS